MVVEGGRQGASYVSPNAPLLTWISFLEAQPGRRNSSLYPPGDQWLGVCVSKGGKSKPLSQPGSIQAFT